MYKLGQMYQYYDENDCCSYVPLTDLTNAVQRHIPSADTNAVRSVINVTFVLFRWFVAPKYFHVKCFFFPCWKVSVVSRSPD